MLLGTEVLHGAILGTPSPMCNDLVVDGTMIECRRACTVIACMLGEAMLGASAN